MKKLKILFALAIVCTTGYFSYNAYKITVMSEAEKFLQSNIEALVNPESGGGNWLPGYSMQGIHVYVGTDIDNNIEFVGFSRPSYSAGITIKFEYKHCCQKSTPGTECNKDGNDDECSYLSLY